MLGSIQQSCEPPDIAEVICMAATQDKNQLRYLAGGASKQLCTGCLEIGKHNWRVNMIENIQLARKLPRQETTEGFMSLQSR